VDAAAEADVRLVAASDVEAVGSSKRRGSRSAAAEQHRHLLADLHRLPGDLDARFEHPSLEQLQRRVPAQHLLDRGARRHLAGHDRCHWSRWSISARGPLPTC
jgi:hypothetical protein